MTPLVSIKDPILKKELEQVDPKKTALQLMFNEFVVVMRYYRTYGMAANHLGINSKVFVIGDFSQPETLILVANPRIVDSVADETYFTESSHLYPNLFVKVKRPVAIRARYMNVNGNTDTIKLNGVTARLFQHYYDWVNGVSFIDRANRIHREQALKKKKKLDKLHPQGIITPQHAIAVDTSTRDPWGDDSNSRTLTEALGNNNNG